MTTAAHLSSYPRLLGILLAIAAVPAALPLFGCDTAVFAAGTTITVMRRASPAIGRLRDPDFAEAALPASIGQMEGILELQPGDLNLRALMARAYVSYGFGFMEDHLEVAEHSGTEEEIEVWRIRASNAYLRGREIAIQGLDQRHPEDGGLLASEHQGFDAFQEHLMRFTSADDDAPLLLFATYAWARYIGLHRDDMNAIADLAFVQAMSERVLAINQNYFDYAPIALHGGLIGSRPAALGGDPQGARTEIEHAIELTHRQNLMYLVTEAQIVAVALQDRALYRSLLEEVVHFDVDTLPDSRLQNIIAQRRAHRWLSRIDEFFDADPNEHVSADDGDGDDDGGEVSAPPAAATVTPPPAPAATAPATTTTTTTTTTTATPATTTAAPAHPRAHPPATTAPAPHH